MSEQDAKPRMFPMRIEQAENGGFIATVLDNSHIIGRSFAFSNSEDLIGWLVLSVFRTPAPEPRMFDRPGMTLSQPNFGEYTLQNAEVKPEPDAVIPVPLPDEAAIERTHQLQRWARQYVIRETGIAEPRPAVEIRHSRYRNDRDPFDTP